MSETKTDDRSVQKIEASSVNNTNWFDPKNNSLNLIRLAMALIVVIDHIFPLTGRGDILIVTPGETVGGWAVFVFFMISGYLITGSRLRSDGGRYLMNRIARIFPAFIFINIVTAFILAPCAFLIERGSLNGFLTTPTTPASYVLTNALLKMNDYSVAGTLSSVPYPHAWNGSLWSLYYEFVAYILVGLFCVFPFVRSNTWPMLLAFVASLSLKIWPGKFIAVASSVAPDIEQFARLLPFFFGGALVFMLKDKLRLVWWGALGSLAVSIIIIVLIPSFGPQLSAPLLTYVILWAGAKISSPRLFQVHDFSYGVYIWGFPLTQMAILLGFGNLPLPILTLLLIVLTLIGAAISWFLVERPTMRWARGKKNPFGEIRQEAR